MASHVASLLNRGLRQFGNGQFTAFIRWRYTRRFATTILSATQYCNIVGHCVEWLQHCSNIATLCCANNRRCESSRVTLPLSAWAVSTERLLARHQCVHGIRWDPKFFQRYSLEIVLVSTVCDPFAVFISFGMVAIISGDANRVLRRTQIILRSLWWSTGQYWVNFVAGGRIRVLFICQNWPARPSPFPS